MKDIIKILKNNPNNVYVTAEIGHNHQGNLETCKQMFLAAKYAGANAVKLQKRENKELYTKAFYNSPYQSENSYAPTYGKHREALEFNEKQYRELMKFANEIKIDFFATAFDFTSLKFLEKINIPAYKIASADLVNTPLLKEIAETGKPIIMSTGGGTFEDIDRAVDTITKINNQLIILHCTASYPANVEDMHLRVIPKLIERYPDYIIGLSDHENGIDAASVGYMLGARVFEKHFTVNRAWKGTDQSFSLEPEGLRKLVRNLKRIPVLLGSDKKELRESEKKPLGKMYKSLVTKKALSKGTKLTNENIAIKSPGGGLPPYELENILGKVLNVSLEEEAPIFNENLD